MPTYDYIIIGAGASGLLLADAFINDPFFKEKRILLLDKSDKEKNDRTWCFWENGEGAFDKIIHKKWHNLKFSAPNFEITPNLTPVHYKMLRGIDFYESYLQRIASQNRVDFKNEVVAIVEKKEFGCSVKTTENSYEGKMVFDSRFDYKKLITSSKYPVLQQHFLGWFIKTKKPVFDINTATFMDFDIPQKGNTRFMYVLPTSATEALVEYTLFSEHILIKSEYEEAIKDYLEQKLQLAEYTITEVEQGNIPMTCYDFTKENTENYLKIGIAGGWAKSSTGYTFYSSTKKAKALVTHLKTDQPLTKFMSKNRFWLYDLLLLDVLHRKNEMGSAIFKSMFKNIPPQLILKFLDEETTLWQEIKVMWSCPKWPFTKALLRRLLKWQF